MADKKLVNYSIDIKIAEQFDIVAKQNSINKSLLIENLIKKWVKENENNKL